MRRRLPGARFALGATLSLGIVPSAAQGAAAEARCRCQLAGSRAQASIDVQGLVDAELERLIRLGLVGRVRWELELSRKRWLWVEQRVAQMAVESAIRFSEKRRVFVVEGVGEVPDLSRLRLDTADLRLDAPYAPDGRYELRIRVRLQVITVDSLARVASWMVDAEKDEGEERPSSWAARGLLRAVSNDLQRVATATCRTSPAEAPTPSK
jgi:hypothetical protein